MDDGTWCAQFRRGIEFLPEPDAPAPDQRADVRISTVSLPAVQRWRCVEL